MSYFSHVRVITIIELCTPEQPSYTLSFIFIETDLHFWSLSDRKHPSLWPLLRKKNYATVYFLWILHSTRGKFSKIVSKCFLQVFKGFKYYVFKKIYVFKNIVFFDESRHFIAYRATWRYCLNHQATQANFLIEIGYCCLRLSPRVSVPWHGFKMPSGVWPKRKIKWQSLLRAVHSTSGPKIVFFHFFQWKGFGTYK